MRARVIITTLFLFANSNVLLAGYDAAALQQLFTDKQQRKQIDAARSGNYESTEAPQTSKVKVSGYVTRSDGKSVVWLNNKNTLKSSKMGDVRVQESNVGKDKKVTLIVDGKRKQLKPGEVWQQETGKIVEGY